MVSAAADTFIMASLRPFWNEHLLPIRVSPGEGGLALSSVPAVASVPPGNSSHSVEEPHFASSNDLLLLNTGLRQRERVLARKLPGYKNLDILGPYATVENIKENNFSKRPARFEYKVRDVVTPVHRDQ
jgi:hypothetical protein